MRWQTSVLRGYTILDAITNNAATRAVLELAALSFNSMVLAGSTCFGMECHDVPLFIMAASGLRLDRLPEFIEIFLFFHFVYCHRCYNCNQGFTPFVRTCYLLRRNCRYL